MQKPVSEKPCLYLMNAPHQPPGQTPGGKGKRAQADCLCDEQKDCPKKRNKLDLTMHCFRIRRPPRKKGGKKP